MTNKRYVVGYESKGTFVVLHSTDSAKVAVAARQRLAKTRKEDIKIKKKGLTRSAKCAILIPSREKERGRNNETEQD